MGKLYSAAGPWKRKRLTDNLSSDTFPVSTRVCVTQFHCTLINYFIFYYITFNFYYSYVIIITRTGSHITKYLSQCGKLIYYYTITL